MKAELTFMPNISKYVLETAAIVAALLVGLVQFAVSDAQHAVSVLSMFLAAGTRLAPAIVRIQQGAFSFRSSAGIAETALTLVREFGPTDSSPGEPVTFTTMHSGFRAEIRVRDVSFSYPDSAVQALENWRLDVAPGAMIALVGPSGAGKSTAADVLLGILEPQHGEVSVSGVRPRELGRLWPGAVGYVPQDVWLASGTVRKNVALGYDLADVEDDAIWAALEVASLAETVREMKGGLDAIIGERGATLSGGQRQRLGIARAVVTQPDLLVMDEATSALDATTEHAVTAAIRALRGSTTLVVVAHRLATVRYADLVQYFDHGRVVAEGTFDAVRERVPDFAAQAALSGL